jgi:hypothetical protein
MRARCPAKVDKQWLAGSRNIRWNLVVGSCQRVSSRAMRNFRQENPIAAPMDFEIPQCLVPLGRFSPHIVHREHDRDLRCDEGRFPARSPLAPSHESRHSVPFSPPMSRVACQRNHASFGCRAAPRARRRCKSAKYTGIMGVRLLSLMRLRPCSTTRSLTSS